MEKAFPVFVSGDCEEDSADAGAGLVIGLCCVVCIYSVDWMEDHHGMGPLSVD